jgi:tetratricopeptide (TPR) repeat protein
MAGMKARVFIGIGLGLLCAAVSALSAPPVRLWETNLVIPTYLAAPPSAVPRFYEGRTYQGAKATFYPYPVQDVLTDIKTNKSYKALFLENEYIQVSVIPELGGRIWSAMDKANGYDFFYRQHVVKPALIGMLGAWISGGVEWNVPHHHRATSFSPVDYTTTTNADGSATIWVGEIELRHRMKWLVGMTLYPDRSYLELTCKMFNRTPFAHPMLFWINTAVHANTNYQVIFPPSTEWAAQHSKPEFASWPIARQTYGGTDYTRGVDISWWKNHPNPVSFFAWNYEDDWFGGYDHGKQAGVVHVADHRVAPGKKFFEWGNGPEGETWSEILTDEDGPYLELMAGAWSDNQPDYSWIQPGETREWKHWWYPIRGMGGVKAATRDAAVNLEVTNRVAKIAVNATKELPSVHVRLRVGDQVLFHRMATISPDSPFSATVLIESEVPTERLRVTVNDPNNQEIVSHQPAKPRGTPMPKPVEKPKSPRDYATIDELYFTGQRIEQLYSPSFEARPYYEEILRRDPGDYRGNTALGILLCKQWRWQEAAMQLSNAIARATANYIHPEDGEAFYYLGIALKAQGKLDSAAEAFGKAAWSQGWQAAACYSLAEIDCATNAFARALVEVERSLQAQALNPKALNLRSAIFRRLERPQEARASASQALVSDPLDLWAHLEVLMCEHPEFCLAEPFWFLAPGLENYWPKLDALFESHAEARLEVVADLGSASLSHEAASTAWQRYKGTNVLLHYHAGFHARLLRLMEFDGDEFQYAYSASPEFCFPFQYELIEILRYATGRGKHEAQAPYLLGNLLYDNQPAQAIQAWETSRERISGMEESLRKYGGFRLSILEPLVHRNLALAYAQHEENVPKAIASLEKAVALDPKEPRFFYELDVQYEAGGAPVAKRLEMLTKHHDTVAKRDDALTREIVLLTVAGQADRAVALLRGRHFRNWEGSSQIHNVYVDACLAHGQQLAAQKQPREALAAYQTALEYPENLEVGRARRAPRTAQIQYLIGTAHEALGEAAAAKAAFEKAAAGRDRGASESSYFHALALQKLGRADDAKPIFERLVRTGQEQLTRGDTADYFAKFGEKTSERVRQANARYLVGLGQLGLGDKAKANAEFKQALDLHPAHLGALAGLAAGRKTSSTP